MDEAAEEPPASDERKVVTVLFADLVSSTELATRLDPEDLRGVLRPFFDAMTEEIERFGGMIEKFIGDAVVAVFGVPIAHEDDPERAVRAGFAMQSRMRGLNEQLAGAAGGDLAMRVGVNTGDVLAHPTTNDSYVTGEAVNLAARLQTLAPVGAVVVGERTYRATSGAIGYRSLGDVSVKGFDHPVAAWEGLPSDRPRGQPRKLGSPMVGRDQELVLLRLLFDRTVAQGKPNLITLHGPPGIGKSRLSEELTAAIAPARVVRGRCLSYGGGLAYWPMAEILKEDAGILDSDAPDAIAAKARVGLDPRFVGTQEAVDTSLVLLASIGIATGSEPLAGLDPAAARRAITAAWRRYFDSLCAGEPLMVLIEDIHWADEILLELIESLAGNVSGPLLVLCTARPELWEQRPGWGSGRSNANTIALAPLSSDDGSTLVENLLGGRASEDLVDQVIRRSEGNPFFSEELLRMMVEDGTVAAEGDRWGLTGALPSSLPDTVQGVIASRIDLLTVPEKRTIQDAAVVGRTFWDGAVARLGSPDAGLTLVGLVDKGLVSERGSTSIEGEREFTFHHILTRDVAYESIPRTRRAVAHRDVTGWIEEVTRGRDEEFAEILSHHAERAGDVERTATYAMLAGHRHRRVFEAAEAIRWYDRAIEALGRLSSGSSALMLVETELSRGEASEQLGRFAEAQADYRRALDAARERPEGSREWLESRALAALVQALWNEDRYREGEELLPEALDAASAQGADDLVARLQYAAGSMAFRQGDRERASSFHHKALEVARAAGDLEMEALARHGLAETGSFTGPFEEALAHGRQADELLRRLGQRPLVYRNGSVVARLHWLLDDPEAAAAEAASSLAGCRDMGDGRDEALALSALAMIEISRGHLGAALQAADEAVSAAETAGSARLELTCRFWRSWSLGELRDHERFADDVRTALEIRDSLGGRSLHAPLEALRGWEQALGGRAEEAEATFARATDAGGDAPLESLLALRLELLCWEELGNAEGLASAARRLGDAARGRSRAFTAWAEFGEALAHHSLGAWDEAAIGAEMALGSAAAAGEIPVLWRSHALIARARGQIGDPDEAAAAVARARTILHPMAEEITSQGTRDRFLARPDVAEVLADGPLPGQA